MVYTWTHGIDKGSGQRQGLMVWKRTHGIDKTDDIDLDSWYRVGTPESQTYKRAKCYHV